MKLDVGIVRLRLVTAACLLLFTYVFVINAWFGDDPYITYRTIDNFVNGYGLVWNTDERVQVYTHPLWMLVLSGVYAFTREAYYSTMAVSFVSSVGAFLVVFRFVAKTSTSRVMVTSLLCSSKAWVDYTSSGLENPLSYLLIALFFSIFLTEHARTRRGFAGLVLIAALAFMNREDTCLLYIVPLSVALIAQVRSGETVKRTLAITALASVPAWGWLVFATIYYGFPFPNTAYSKLNGGGHSMPFFSSNGIDYFANSLRWDPVTLPFIAITLLFVGYLAVKRFERWQVTTPAMAGVVLYLAYTMRIGGDYMSGRFFSLPFCLAVVVAASLAEHVAATASLAALAPLVALMGPRVPILRTTYHEVLPFDATFLRDESGQYYEASSLLLILKEHRESPGVTTSRAGTFMHELRPRVVIWGAIGYFGFVSGPDVDAIDPIGLSDPLLARLPANNTDGWGRGHFFHGIPEGYTSSIELSRNLIKDPALHEYYDKLRLVTRGPIFTMDRFREIYRINVGHENPLIAKYIAARDHEAVADPQPESAALIPKLDAPVASDDEATLAALLANAHVSRENVRFDADLRSFPLPKFDSFSGPGTDAVFRSDAEPDSPPPSSHRSAFSSEENVAIISSGRLLALRLAHVEFDSPPDLRAFSELRALDLDDDGLGQAPELPAPNLQFLDLSSNGLSSMTGVSNLTHLRALYLTHNSIGRIDGLSEMSELLELNLALNTISQIDGLQALRQLRLLSFEGNRVTKIEGLESLGALRFLNLSYCRIESIENLGSLTSLGYLNLTHNKIHSTHGTSDANTRLFYLSLTENPLEDEDQQEMDRFNGQGAGRNFYLR